MIDLKLCDSAATMGISVPTLTSLLACLITFTSAQPARYNPCNKPGKVTRGQGFVVGVALWPGGTFDDWKLNFNTTAGVNEPGWSPCRTLTVNGTQVAGRTHLESQGVLFSTYAVFVDTLTSVSLFWHDVERAWAAIPPGGNQVLSAIVFRDAIRSEPIYIRSENTTLTQGNGTASMLSFAARFKAGELEGFDWMASGCSACGGFNSRTCITGRLDKYVQETCAVPTKPNCTLAAVPELPSFSASASWANCQNLTLFMGFVGDDARNRVLRSGYQVARVSQFSLTATIDKLAKAITDALRKPAALFNQSDTLIGPGDIGLA